MEVADLVAQGLTNVQVAEKLVISPRKVPVTFDPGSSAPSVL